MQIPYSKFFKTLIYIIALIIFFDVFIFRHCLNFGSQFLNENINDSRKPSQPYSYFIDYNVAMATKGNVAYNGNSLWYPQEPDKDTLKVALFGGSTAIYTFPSLNNIPGKTLAIYLCDALASKLHKKVAIANFACPGANHRQHLHMLLEYLPKYKPDIVIFYGGNNETAQYIQNHDPRPGYPFNFFYRSDLPVWKKLLLENSAIAGVLYDRFGFLSNIEELRRKAGYETESWNQEIVTNYFETLELSKVITNSFSSSFFGKAVFIALFQPFKTIDYAHDTQTTAIKAKIPSYNYIVDLHNKYDKFDEKMWVDKCHVHDEANKYMANVIADTIIKKIKF